MTDSREHVMRKVVQHGAEEVTVGELIERSLVSWRLGPDEEISRTCIGLEEFNASAARNAEKALRVIKRATVNGGLRDRDLLTALKKYVEDTCEALRVVDNRLKKKVSDLDTLFAEVPNESTNDDMSWRNLIGRRNVIAHNLLTVDDERVYCEAVRDFGNLHQLLSRTYFVPKYTDLAAGRGFDPLIRADAIRMLLPASVGKTPGIGESLIFVCEDRQYGFVSIRLGRTKENRALFSISHAPSRIRLEFHALKLDTSQTNTPNTH